MGHSYIVIYYFIMLYIVILCYILLYRALHLKWINTVKKKCPRQSNLLKCPSAITPLKSNQFSSILVDSVSTASPSNCFKCNFVLSKNCFFKTVLKLVCGGRNFFLHLSLESFTYTCKIRLRKNINFKKNHLLLWNI